MVADTDELERAVQVYAVAWSSGDSKVAAASFTEDAVRVDAAGGVQHGRAETAAALEALVHRTLTAPKIALVRGTVRSLAPNLALWRGDMEIATPAGPLKGNAVFLMRRDAGHWSIWEAHPKLYPPPP